MWLGGWKGVRCNLFESGRVGLVTRPPAAISNEKPRTIVTEPTTEDILKFLVHLRQRYQSGNIFALNFRAIANGDFSMFKYAQQLY
jgi:hypothetical protein